jgi:death-on-curing protein
LCKKSGVVSAGDIEYAVERIREGHFGHVPESLHGKAFQLLRLIVANDPFVDGNKRTALMSVYIFYALNGIEFAYDRRIKETLKNLATDETSVEKETILSYLQEYTDPLEPEYRATIELWLSESEPNDYESEPRNGE